MTELVRLTTLGHSCVLIEVRSASHTRHKLLLDPGSLTPALSPIDDLTAILVTHAHADHVDPEQIRRLRTQENVPVYGDEGTAKLLADANLNATTIAGPGQLEIAEVSIGVSMWPHARIYPGVPVPVNYGYHIAGQLFAPGDAFAVPDFPVDVLLLPTGAPWMKLSETIDYLRTLSPRIAIPVHDGGLAMAHREMHRGLMQKFAPSGTTVLRPDIGEAIDLTG